MTIPKTDPQPGQAAYLALLACSTLGTLSSTLISAPINVIARAMSTTPQGIVLAVSAFTVAMVAGSPLVGWMCTRYGARFVLAGALAIMVLAQAGAAQSTELSVLVAMRALQGVACSAIPPAIQQVLGRHWASSRAQVMAAWASAIGLGQAIGPPLGGFATETFGWRSIFMAHAILSLVLLVLIITLVPAVPPASVPLHAAGMFALMTGAVAIVGAFTWAGQGGHLGGAAVLAAVGLATLTVFLRMSATSTQPFIAPRLLLERRFTASSAAAGTVMGALGVVIVATPLLLGRDADLNPGGIGIVMLPLALAMILVGPVSSWLTKRFTAGRTLRIGLMLLAAGMLCLPLALSAGTLTLAFTIGALILTGAAIGVVQATAAVELLASPGGANGAALGVHNMLRFTGLAIGYSWVALMYRNGSASLVYVGPVLPIALSWILARDKGGG